MKKSKHVYVMLAAVLFALLCNSKNSFAQHQYTGSWEGIFMGDFKLVILLSYNVSNGYQGNLKMFSGNNMIQNDPLSKISIEGNNITFYLESKKTAFKGTFNKDVSELIGEFTFPDGVKHALTVSKTNADANTIKSFHEIKTYQFSTDELRSDFNYLIESLKEYHPQLYYYADEKELVNLWEMIYSGIIDEMTLEDFYTLVAPVTDKIHCSHTGVRLPENYIKLLYNDGNFLPLNLKILEGKAYFVSDCCNSETDISKGDEVISINGKHISEIMSQLMPYIPSEGLNVTTKYNEINRHFNRYYYFINDHDSFEIEFSNSTGKKNEVTVPACKYYEYMHKMQRPELYYPLKFSIDNKHGYLKLESFSFQDVGKYIEQMDSIFQVLDTEKINKLIIDLRDNAGGHPIFAAQLLSYLSQGEFTYFKRNHEIMEFEPLYNPMQTSKYRFNGDIYVFVNGGCLSTTGHLISLLKFHTNAIFIGQEPGSTFRCNDFSIQVTLPATGIEVNIPRTSFETAVSGPAALVPFVVDLPVEASMEDCFSDDDLYKKLFEKQFLQKN